MLWSRIPHLGNKRTWEWVSRGVRGKRWKAVVVPSAVTEAETACLMTARRRIVYSPPPSPAEAPRMSVSSHRVCPLLKATRVRLSITSLLKDTFNYAPLSRDHFFRELCISLACALRNGTTRSTCCFLPPIKGHVDRLRLLLVCAPLTQRKMMNMGWVGGWGGHKEREREGDGEREADRKRKRNREKEHAHEPWGINVFTLPGLWSITNLVNFYYASHT